MSKKVHSKLLLYSDLSNKAFLNYSTAKLFLHAKCIKKNNMAIYKLLEKHIHIFSEEIQNEVFELLNHYDVWMIQFSDFRKTNKPKLNDSFVFFSLDSKSKFPKEAIPRILSYLKRTFQ